MMDLLKNVDVEGQESGMHFVPDEQLQNMKRTYTLDESKAFAELVEKYPNREFSMVYDVMQGGLKIYWRTVA